MQLKMEKRNGRSSGTKRGVIAIGTAVLCCIFYTSSKYYAHYLSSIGRVQSSERDPDSLCPIPDIIAPKHELFDQKIIQKIIHDEEYRNASLEKLAGSIKFPTEVYDEWGYIDDHPEKWDNYFDLHDYLNSTFPKVHSELELEKVYAGLLYTWQGSEPDLKPLVLMLHQDVVPVQIETIKDWTYPPFEGVYDGEFVWGRGACDCKSLLISLLESVELLIEQGFKPRRTIILSLGADEEAIGRSLYLLSRRILEKYGEDSIYQIIDEGGSGFEERGGRNYLGVNTGEKGYLDAQIELFTPGGHSSVPPDHTSIGIMAELVHEIERSPYEPQLTNMNPMMGALQCYAEHSPEMDSKLRSNILKSHLDVDANAEVIKWMEETNGYFKYVIRTSQLIDIVRGGAKSNALPEHVSILVNNRIAVESTVEFTSNKLKRNLLDVADKHDLGLVIENEVIKEATLNGHFNFTYRDPLATAPVTPINDETWDLFVGTLRNLYEKDFYPDLFHSKDGDDDYLVVIPTISTGNTDTKSYWDLTDHIYRFIPGSMNKFDAHAHSVDEKIDIESHLFTIAFYYEYLLNLDSES